MPRYLDLECAGCGAEVNDLFVMTVPPRIVHFECGGTMEQVYRLRPRSAQWSDKDAVVVFRKPDGTLSYPARNDKPTPENCERIELRSMRQVEQFERAHNVVAHIAHFDSGSGRSHDDTPPSQHRDSERVRYERFRELTRGIL